MSFTKGMLYIRVRNGKFLELFFPLEDVSEDSDRSFSIYSIARYQVGGSPNPIFGQETEGAYNTKAPMHSIITFRVASDWDLQVFLSNWKQTAQYTVIEWEDHIRDLPGLQMKEKARVSKIIQSIYAVSY